MKVFLSLLLVSAALDAQQPFRHLPKLVLHDEARISARRHFPGDVMAGAAMGWFIGEFTYAHRARANLP